MDKIIEQDCLELLDRIDFNPLRGKAVVITGANGLIGTYLIYLIHMANLKKGLNAKIVGISKNKANNSLSAIFNNDNIFYAMDLTRYNLISAIDKADYIIHGAGYAQPTKFYSDPFESMTLNTFTTDLLLSKAVRDEAKFLFLSSSEIYGNPGAENIPTAEAYPGCFSPIELRSIYAESKRMGETFCYAYKEYKKVDVKIARISITYGPGISVNDSRVIGNFIKMALIDGEIRMLDQGEQLRTFCYISDCIYMLMEILISGKDFVYNVGGTNTLSIRELAEDISFITGSKLKITDQARNNILRTSAPEHVRLNIDKACKEFKIKSFINMSEGLKRTIEWNRKFMNHAEIDMEGQDGMEITGKRS